MNHVLGCKNTARDLNFLIPSCNYKTYHTNKSKANATVSSFLLYQYRGQVPAPSVDREEKTYSQGTQKLEGLLPIDATPCRHRCHRRYFAAIPNTIWMVAISITKDYEFTSNPSKRTTSRLWNRVRRKIEIKVPYTTASYKKWAFTSLIFRLLHTNKKHLFKKSKQNT